MMKDIRSKYKKAAVENATDLESVVILYDEAITSLKTAKENFAQKKPEFKDNINFARKIIQGLTLLLDFKQGGSIAENLYALYNYMDKRLLVAQEGIMATPRYIDEISDFLSKLRESWYTLSQKEKERVKAETKAAAKPLQSGHLEISA